MKKHIFTSFLVLGLALPLLTTATTTQPTESAKYNGVICEDALRELVPFTLPHLTKMALEDIAEARKTQPVRNFFSLDEEMKITRHGVKGPKTLQAAIGNLRFMEVPTAHSPTGVSVGSPEEGFSMPLRLDGLTWNGNPAGTLAYVNLPYNLTPKDSDYVVGPQYEHVAIFSHGGGTQHARAENSVTYGNVLGKRGIAVLAFDLPGHGDSVVGDVLMTKAVCDWLADAIDLLVDPRVKKISLNFGHSYGAMLVAYMRNHSADNPKYARILKALSISPAVDVSLGGDINKKLEFERWYEQNYNSRADDIAPKDKKFLDTQTENDKYAITALYAVKAAYLDYETPVIPVEEQRKLIPQKVVTGKADGLVYVAHEEPYDAAWGNLNEVGNGSELRILGPGPTFKSKNAEDVEKTGHQAMDVEDPVTRKPIVYKMIGDYILGEAEFARPEGPVSKADEILTQLTHHYAHFFPFRKLLENYVRYKRIPTPQLKVDSDRKDELIAYINQVNSIRSRMGSEQATSKAVKAQMDGFGKRFGIDEIISLKQAQDELAFPEFTPERKAKLEKFLRDVELINTVYMPEWDDPQTPIDRKALWNKHKKLFEEVNATLPKEKQILVDTLENYKEVWTTLKEMDKGTSNSELSKDEQKEIRKRDGFRKGLATVDREYIKLMEDVSKRFGEQRFKKIDEASPQADIKIPKLVERELNAAERSEEERAKRNKGLQAFIAAYPQALEQAKSAHQAAIQAEINKLKKPNNINDVSAAEAEAKKIEELQNLMYAVPGEPELQELAAEIQALGQEKDGLPDNFDEVLKLRKKRIGLIKKWNKFWEDNALVTQPLLNLRAKYDDALNTLKGRLHELGAAIDDYFLVEYQKHRTITKETIINRPQHLRDLEAKLLNERNAFLKLKQELAALQLQVGLKIGFEESPALQEVKKIAFELSSDPKSLTSEIAALEEVLSEKVARKSVLTQRREYLQWKYAKLMKEKGFLAPYEMQRIDAYKLVDQDLAGYYALFESSLNSVSVLEDLLNTWKPMLTYMRETNLATED